MKPRSVSPTPRELTIMKRFLVTYLAPASVLAEWKKTDPDTRKAAQNKMQAEWKKWMNDHANMFADIGAGVGKTKLVTVQGISDTKNRSEERRVGKGLTSVPW